MSKSAWTEDDIKNMGFTIGSDNRAVRKKPSFDMTASLAQKAAFDEPAPTKRHKYRNEPVTVDGIAFDSKKEAARYLQLVNMQRAGTIRDLVYDKARLQWPLIVNGVTIGVYTCDFSYVDVRTGRLVVEDVKSRATKTEAYGLRKRLMAAIHGVEIREV